MTEDERAELDRLRYEARLFNAALYATMRDYQILQAELRRYQEAAMVIPAPKSP